eukprot:GHVT01080340.1.p1 GENE.GHVT01080340.1~~GHVT01080340.1.p1  ORF type:complete len:207 (+),score=12.30 GHVT01080340.1:1474-2094(+)
MCIGYRIPSLTPREISMGSYDDSTAYSGISIGAMSPSSSSPSSSSILKTYHYKLVLLGETCVGKSCIVYRFAKDEFCQVQESTIGAAFMTQSVNLGDAVIKFEIWDTAGQERYRSLAPMYYRGAAAAVIVYDITSRDSFEQAKSWLSELRHMQQPEGVIALAGNKDDLEAERTVRTEVRHLAFTQSKNAEGDLLLADLCCLAQLDR